MPTGGAPRSDCHGVNSYGSRTNGKKYIVIDGSNVAMALVSSPVVIVIVYLNTSMYKRYLEVCRRCNNK